MNCVRASCLHCSHIVTGVHCVCNVYTLYMRVFRVCIMVCIDVIGRSFFIPLWKYQSVFLCVPGFDSSVKVLLCFLGRAVEEQYFQETLISQNVIFLKMNCPLFAERSTDKGHK